MKISIPTPLIAFLVIMSSGMIALAVIFTVIDMADHEQIVSVEIPAVDLQVQPPTVELRTESPINDIDTPATISQSQQTINLCNETAKEASYLAAHILEAELYVPDSMFDNMNSTWSEAEEICEITSYYGEINSPYLDPSLRDKLQRQSDELLEWHDVIAAEIEESKPISQRCNETATELSDLIESLLDTRNVMVVMTGLMMGDFPFLTLDVLEICEIDPEAETFDSPYLDPEIQERLERLSDKLELLIPEEYYQ